MIRMKPVLLAPFGWLIAASAHAQAAPPATPIQITATQGIEWKQADNEAIATGNAQAVRGPVTVDADRLIAHYRKKGGAAAAPAVASGTDPESALNAGNTEIYELEALGHVHIFTKTDNAYGDHAVYSMDSDVLVLTGQDLKLTTPADVITAKNSIEYYSGQRMAVARGDALIAANDGRSMAADTITGYLDPASGSPAPAAGAAPDMLGQSGKLEKVDAVGHVTLRTPQQTATGDTGVYLPQQGLARLGGNVHVISGVNVLSGSDAVVNTKSSTATMLSSPGGQVAGTVTPQSNPPPKPPLAGAIHKIKLPVPHTPMPVHQQVASGDTGIYQPQKGLPGLGGNIHIDSNPNTLTGSGPLADKKISAAMLQPAAAKVIPPVGMEAAAAPPPVIVPPVVAPPVFAPLPPDSPLSLER